MKKFVISVLSISVFFVGLGSLADKVGATFKSDEKALDIVRKARTAIGGDAAIAEVRSLTIAGRTTHTFKDGGADRSEQGETEIALQFPDKMMRMVKIGKDDGTGEKSISKQHEVVIVRKGEGDKVILEGHDGEILTPDGQKVTIRKRVDGGATLTTEDGKKVMVRKIESGTEGGVWKVKTGDGVTNEDKHVMLRSAHPGAHAGMKQNEMLRLTLALLLTAPEGIDVNYTFAGESDVDGTGVNIINAEFGGANYKLFIGKSSNLPVAMSFVGHEMPRIVKFTHDGPVDGAKDVKIFTRKLEGEPAKAEQFVRFSDYRTTGGVQLPYKWTTTSGSGPGEVFEVTSYEINPANIAEKFADQKVFVRTAKPKQN